MLVVGALVEVTNPGFVEVVIMGFTAIIALFVLVIFILTAYFLISGIRKKDWKQIVLSVLGFIIIIGGVYWALISFITSM